MKRPEFWNRLFNSGRNGISIFVGPALIAVIAVVITACPGAAPGDSSYTVSYNVNEGDSTAPAAEKVNDGGTAAKPADPTRSGYTFTGWFDAQSGGNEFNFGTAVTADITLYAQWVKQHTVTYHANGGDNTPVPATQTVNHGETIASAPTGISRTDGYTLNTAWNTEVDNSGDFFLFGDVGDGGTPVTEDITLYAQWANQQYTVTYDANGGTGTLVPENQKVNRGDIIPVAPTGISRTGHTLNAVWNSDPGGRGHTFQFGSEGTTVTYDWDLYAQWTAFTYTVSYNLNGGDGTAPAAETVDHDKTAPKPTDPTRSGHAFTGWFDAESGGNVYNFGTKVTADIELYARWVKQYTVSYDLNEATGTVPDDEAVNDGGTAIRPTTDPTRTGHTFVGWFDAQSGGNEFNFGTGGTPVTDDITLYARWAATTTTYTVSYHVNGGDSTTPASETVADGTTAAEPPRPTRSGHAFTGWFDAQLGGNEFNFGNGGTPVTSDITLYARWTPDFYKVTFDPNYGSETPTTQNVPQAGGKAVREDPARTGYSVTGWYTAQSGGTEFNFDTEITAATTLYAQWTANQYVVSLDENDRESGTPVTVTATYDALLPTNQAAPTRSDLVENYDHTTSTTTSAPYVFKGYFKNDDGTGTQYYDENMTPTTAWDQDTAAAIYAHWAKPTYTVTLDIKAGSNGGTTTSVVATLGEFLPLDSTILSPTSNYDRVTFKGYTDSHGTGVAAPGDAELYYKTGGDGNPVIQGGRTWNVTGDTTIYAVYKSDLYDNKVTIKDPDDNTFSGIVMMQADGIPVHLDYTPPTRSGYSIVGYTVNSDGSGTVWAHPPDQYQHGTGNWDWSQETRTVYIKWEQD